MLRRGGFALPLGATSFRNGVSTTFKFLSLTERRRVALILLSSALNSVLGLSGILGIVPFFRLLIEPTPLAPGSFFGDSLRRMGIETETHAVVAAGLGVVTLVVLKNVYGVVHLRLVNRFCAQIETRATTEILRYFIEAPFSWYVQQSSSVLRDVVLSDVLEWSRSFVRPSLNLFNDLLLLLLAIAALVLFTPTAGLAVTVVGGALAAALLALCSPRVMLATRRKRHHSVVAGVAATEAINGGRDVRMSGAGKVLLHEFRRNYAVYAYSDADSRQWQQIPRSGIEIVGLTVLVGIAIGAILLGMDRVQTATMLAVYALVAVRLIPLLAEVSRGASVLQETMLRCHLLMTLMERVLAVKPAVKPANTYIEWRNLTFRGVTYRYGEETLAALDNIDLTIAKGGSYGFVGSSGAGKSTFADLLAGLIDPTSGEVALDGVVFSPASRAAWRERVAYVSQHPILFDSRLSDNIMLGDQSPDAPERLKMAISQAGLDSVVAGLPDGSETILGDKGIRLSGGQRQRVAIARALYQKVDVLILDEATSALDSVTEAEVTEAINALKGRTTLIVIAHRLSTVANCDEIILLSSGKVIARGSHSQLIEASPEYAQLVNSQAVSA